MSITLKYKWTSRLRNCGSKRRGGYDPSAGIFTAPIEGMYVFDWTILTQNGKYAFTSLVVNGTIKSWNYCNDSVTKTYEACSKRNVVKLKQGNKVWIGVFSEPANKHSKYTTFFGFNL